MNNNIIIFGTGEFGKDAYLYYSKQNNINIIAFADNNKEKHNSFFYDIKIISAKDIMSFTYDKIVIASSFDKEISSQLELLNVEADKINILSLNDVKVNLSEGNKLLLAEELMFDLASEFNKEKIEYHIDHGTLLGIIRDKSIMPWDIDVDFAILESQKDKTINILTEFLKIYKSKYCLNNHWKCALHNCTMNINDEEKNLPMVIKIFNDINDVTSNSFFIDIEIKYVIDTNLCWMIGSRKLSCDYSICFPTKSMDFKGNLIKIPNQTNKYLESLYGNWEKVVKQWSYDQYENINE